MHARMAIYSCFASEAAQAHHSAPPPSLHSKLGKPQHAVWIHGPVASMLLLYEGA